MLIGFKRCLALAALAGLCSCAPEILPTTTHAAIAPEQVMIYQNAPLKYERLATITHVVGSTTQWRENADATPAFTDLMAQAAALGANGLLLKDDSNKSTIMAGARFQDKYYLVPLQDEPKTVIVQAIYVPK